MWRENTISHMGISIHAPRTGSDAMFLLLTGNLLKFQSTLPARGATIHPMQLDARPHISIHAPRTGSDLARTACTRHQYISIHAPRTGSDRHMFPSIAAICDFNPRSPHGERLYGYLGTIPVYISIHAPRTGSDRRRAKIIAVILPISIHAPRTGSDRNAQRI